MRRSQRRPELQPDGEQRGIATVRYTWTAPGVALVRSKTPEAYTHVMHRWEAELNHHLTSGGMLSPEP